MDCYSARTIDFQSLKDKAEGWCSKCFFVVLLPYENFTAIWVLPSKRCGLSEDLQKTVYCMSKCKGFVILQDKI